MSSDYVKQLEETVEALKQKLNTLFDWRVVETPYEFDRDTFMIQHECYIHDQLYAMIGLDPSVNGGYKGICKGTVSFDTNLDSVKKSIEQTYFMHFYPKIRI
jgi:hypothetical protein